MQIIEAEILVKKNTQLGTKTYRMVEIIKTTTTNKRESSPTLTLKIQIPTNTQCPMGKQTIQKYNPGNSGKLLEHK